MTEPLDAYSDSSKVAITTDVYAHAIPGLAARGGRGLRQSHELERRYVMPSEKERIARLETQMVAVDKMIRAADVMIRALYEKIENLENSTVDWGANSMRTEVMVTSMKLILGESIPKFSELVDQMTAGAMDRIADKLEKSP